MIITDYNHGLISKKIGSFISKKFKNKYSLNCQLNSSNMRYQALSKYKNMKLVVINETELRYEFRIVHRKWIIWPKKINEKTKYRGNTCYLRKKRHELF